MFKKFTSILLLFCTIQLSHLCADAIDITKPYDTQFPPLREYENVYRSHAFDDYLSQLNEFVWREMTHAKVLLALLKSSSEPLVEEIASFVTFVTKSNLSNLNATKAREVHEDIILRIRNLIQYASEARSSKKEEVIQAVKFVDHLSVWIFTEADTVARYIKFLDLNKTSLKEKSLVPLINELETQFNAMKDFSGYYYPVDSTCRDPRFDGHLPTKLYKAFNVEVMMMARATIEDHANRKISINPEFIHYLRTLKRKKKKHLYVNLMNRVEVERELCLAIENLAEQEEFKDILYVMGMDKNSTFYWQKGAEEQHRNVNDFKASFLQKLFHENDKNSQFKWPSGIDLNVWQSKVETILEQVQNEYFSGIEVLSPQECRDFIELTLVSLIEEMSAFVHPHYMNISCKYTIDRGPSLLSLFYMKSIKAEGKVLTVKRKRAVLAMLFASPLIAHNRPPHQVRLDRFTTAFERMFHCNNPMPHETSELAEVSN